MGGINTNHKTLWFGKHKGELWTRVPVSYLRWLVNNPAFQSDNNYARLFADAELKRRGTILDHTIEISGHAIDRASLRLRGRWRETRKDDEEGLYAWLVRLSTEARKYGVVHDEGKLLYKDIYFVFAEGAYYPILQSIMPKKRE